MALRRYPEAHLIAAKAHLDRLTLYPSPVRVDRVRVVVAPWVFRLPLLRRFAGYATWRVIFLRSSQPNHALLVHELCHVWQMQHHPIRMPLSYLRGYHHNRFEVEARQAAASVAQLPLPTDDEREPPTSGTHTGDLDLV